MKKTQTKTKSIVLSHLTEEEAIAINNATRVTRTDCWFSLVEELLSMYRVFDVEGNKYMPLPDALSYAMEDFQSLENLVSLGLAEEEAKLVEDVLRRFMLIK